MSKKIIVCPECDKEYKIIKHYEKHINMCKGKNMKGQFKCQKCNKDHGIYTFPDHILDCYNNHHNNLDILVFFSR